MLTGRGCHRAFQEDRIAVYLDLRGVVLPRWMSEQSLGCTLQICALYCLYTRRLCRTKYIQCSAILLTIASGLGDRRWAIPVPA